MFPCFHGRQLHDPAVHAIIPRFQISNVLREGLSARLHLLVPVHLRVTKTRKTVTEAQKMSARVFLVFCVYFFSCNVLNAGATLPEYCGKESYSYSPLRKGAKGQGYELKQVHVIMRYNLAKSRVLKSILRTRMNI